MKVQRLIREINMYLQLAGFLDGKTDDECDSLFTALSEKILRFNRECNVEELTDPISVRERLKTEWHSVVDRFDKLETRIDRLELLQPESETP